RAAAGAHDGDVGHRDGHVLVDDAALHRGPGLALALLDPVDAVDDHRAARRQGAHDLAFLAPVLASEHLDAVALPDLHRHHNTSGAREMIRMNRFSRSSRPTGPKMRVPRGSPPSRISTAAFSSNLM